MLLFPAPCGRRSTIVCTGHRLVRARVVLWCTSDLASIKHFASVSLRIYCGSGVFFHLYSVFFRHVFLQPEPTLGLYVRNKQKRQHVWYVRVMRVHIHIYTLLTVPIYCDTTYINYSSVAACIVGTQVDIQYTTAVRVHVPGTYIYIYIFIVHCNNNQ